MKTWRLAIALVTSMLAGCASTSETPLPRAQMPSRWTATAIPDATVGAADPRDRAQSLSAQADLREDWWSAFGGARIDRLVRGALAGNPSLAVATATLRQAREVTLAQAATQWPTLTAGVGGVQAHGVNASVINSGAPRSRTALLSASYAPDLFGMNASGLGATKAQEDAARWQFEAVRVTLAGAVLNALAAEKSAVRIEQLTRRLVDIDENVFEILESRESLGDVATAVVWAQSQQLHDRLAQLAAARLQTAQARDLLSSLLGDAPANFVEPDIDFDELTLSDLAPRLPGDVIAHRPDVQMAAAQLRGANAAHQAAIAALLPQVVLSGDAGDVSAAVKRLFDPASLVWDLGVSATQGLFDAGAQRHRVAAAQALADTQAAQYRSTILGAFKEVADGLEAVRHDAELDVEAVERFQAAQHQFEIASTSHALGQISRQDLLVSQSQVVQMQLLQVQARASRLIATANLMVSLGGSFGADGAQARTPSISSPALGMTFPTSNVSIEP